MIPGANCLTLANDTAEVTVSLDYGPRILGYRRLGHDNIFKVYPEQLDGGGEADWVIRGGHRLWVAPETEATYVADNSPVRIQHLSDRRIILEPAPEIHRGIQKRLEVALADNGTKVTVMHRLTALIDLPSPVSAWAITVLREGGEARVPQPPLGLHPSDLDEETSSPDTNYQANRQLALWHYTDMNDGRFKWTTDALSVSQQAGRPSTKIGILQTLGAVSYDINGCRFNKTVPFVPEAAYPDRGCNLEIYTNSEMLELETLSPLRLLKRGETIEHTEIWTLDTL